MHAAKKRQKQVKELLMHLVPRAAKVLESMLEDKEQRGFAAKEILDRVYGKARQEVETKVTGGFNITFSTPTKES